MTLSHVLLMRIAFLPLSQVSLETLSVVLRNVKVKAKRRQFAYMALIKEVRCRYICLRCL